MSRYFGKGGLVVLPVLFSLFLAPSNGNGQQAGNVTGSITDAATGRLLQGVQVSIPGTGIGAITNAQGSFLLLNVPDGEVVLSAQLIGYSTASQEVRVQAGETTEVRLQLESTALALDELVVTATGVRRKIEIGNSLATISAPSQVEARPINDLTDLLEGQSTGVQIIGSGGSVGMGS